MAQSVGFEPTCLLGQLDFESSSLWPLRYDCMNLLVHYSKLLIPPQDLAFTLRRSSSAKTLPASPKDLARRS